MSGINIFTKKPRPLPPPNLEGETDCEDQGFSRISDGCLKFECQTWKGLGNSATPVHPKLKKQERYGKWWWTCPKCMASYGEARAPRVRPASTRVTPK